MKDGTFDPEEPNLILQLQSSPKMTDKSVDAILLDLLTAGTDSVSCVHVFGLFVGYPEQKTFSFSSTDEMIVSLDFTFHLYIILIPSALTCSLEYILIKCTEQLVLYIMS